MILNAIDVRRFRILKFGVLLLISILLGTLINTTTVNATESITYRIGGTNNASIVSPGLAGSTYALKTNTAPSTLGGMVLFENFNGMKFGSMHTLSTDFKITQGECTNTSPRFYIVLDVPNQVSSGRVDLYIQPDGSACGNQEQNTGNLAFSSSSIVNWRLPYASSTPTMTQAQAANRWAEYPIQAIGLVGGDTYFRGFNQTVLFDNIKINDRVFGFEPADTTPPVASITSPSNGSTVYGDIPISGNVSDNSQLASYTIVIKNSEGDIVVGPNTVPVSENIVDEELMSVDTTLIPDGSYTIELTAVDTAGNQGPEISTIVNIAVNNVPDNKEQCMNNNFTVFPANFKNQGKCISSIVSQASESGSNRSLIGKLKNFLGL